MATHKGSEGTVKVGSNAVAEIRSYSIEESADTLEDTSMGDSARTYKPSLQASQEVWMFFGMKLILVKML